jgi:hypothetical protein
MAASVTTDTAYRLIIRICEEMSAVLPGIGTFPDLLEIVGPAMEESDVNNPSGEDLVQWIAMPSVSILDNFTNVLQDAWGGPDVQAWLLRGLPPRP